MKILKFWGVLAALLWISAPVAQAALGGYISVEGGVGLLNAGAGSRFNLGISAGKRLVPPNLILGSYYEYIPFGSVSSPSGIGVSGSEKFYGVEGRWDFTPLVAGLSAGLRAGLSSVSTQAVVPATITGNNLVNDNESATGFAWGPVFVYERPISASFTFGGLLYFMIPSEAAANNVMGIQATLKWWF